MEGKGKVGLLSICRNHCIGLLAIISVVIQSRITSAQTVFPTDDLTTTKFLFTTTEQGLSLRPIIVDCPENVSWPILMGQLGANVNWTEPTAVQRNESLGSDGIFVIRPKEGPGTYFSAAETHVIRYLFQSSDANVIVCEFPILFNVLEDTEEPDVDCPPDVNINVPFNQPFDFVSWSEPTATDNSGVVYLVGSSHSPNTAFPVGVTNVTYTYQDPSGLTNSCTFSVAVISNELDTVPPNITNCPDRDITVIALSSEGGKNVTWRPPDVTDNSGNVTHFVGHR
ncbi:hyalin-like [Apostichopus japonicus]|uniref:hyalin-like n=1 Tax=Stichopus japonicus TaxID=307972 RepID=UPI003AB1691B